ncbi:MAG TPA: glycosyltransferase family 39 protein [Anaerolineae bacterium]
MTSSNIKPSPVLGSFSFASWILLTLITLTGLALRVFRLDFQPLWGDEGYSLFFATRDFATMLERTAVDIHPPLYYALLQAWMVLFGKSDVAVRLLSAVIGVAAIPMVYVLARTLSRRKGAALAAAVLLALSPLHIYYSQEVRMYGLVTLLCLTSMYLFVRLLSMPLGTFRTAIFALAYIVVSAAALYTHYYAAFILSAQVLLILIPILRSALRRYSEQIRETAFRPLLHWLLAWISIGILYLPWLVYAGLELYSYVTAKATHEAYAPLDPITYTAQHLVAFSIGHVTDWTWLWPASIILIALAFTGILSSRASSHLTFPTGSTVTLSPGLLLSLYLLIPLALGFLVNLVYPFHPIHNERLLLLAAPALYILAAFGIEIIWKRGAIFGVLALTLVMVISAASLCDFYTVPRYPNDDYRPLISNLQSLAQPGDVLLAIYPWQIGYLESYYAGPPLRIVETPSDRWINNPQQMRTEVDTLLAQHSAGSPARVWLPALQTLGRLLEDSLDGYLRPRDYAVEDTWFGTTRLELFERAEDPPPNGRPLSFDGLAFARWGIATGPLVAGDGIVRIWFDSGDTPPPSLKVSLRLADVKGNVWAQDDRGLERGVQRIGLAIPAGTPPGEYALYLAIYRSSDDSPLRPVADPNRRDVPLANIVVHSPTLPNLAAVPHSHSVDMNNNVQLVGYEASDKPIRPGEPAGVTLFWRGVKKLGTDYGIGVQLQDDRGKTWATTHAPPAYGIYPSSHWSSNELVRDPQTFTPRADTPDGSYNILVTLLNLQNQPAGPGAIIGKIQVKGRPHYFGAPTPPHAKSAHFGAVAHLLGYDVSTERRRINLALYWQSLEGTPTSYTVFAHVIDPNGQIVGQQDQIPGNGVYPTTSWVKGEYLIDEYDITLSTDSDPNNLQIEIGLYDARTGERLPVFDDAGQPAGDHISIGVR